MLPLRVATRVATRRSSALHSDPKHVHSDQRALPSNEAHLDSLVASLSTSHLQQVPPPPPPPKEPQSTSPLTLPELERAIDDKSATPTHRLQYITSITGVRSELARIGAESYSAEITFKGIKKNRDQLVSAVDKLCKLKATNTQTFRSLMGLLSQLEPLTLHNTPLTALIEIAATNEELRVIEEDKWREEMRKMVGELIKKSSLQSEMMFSLRRSTIWKGETIQAVKDNFYKMSFNDKLTLLKTLSDGKMERDEQFLNTLANDIANDPTTLNLRQCVNLASNCLILRLNPSRLRTKLVGESMEAIGVMEKWSDARTLTTLFAIWKVSDDRLWAQLCAWMERRLKNAPFTDLSAVVSVMGDLGRMEGGPLAAEMALKMSPLACRDALVWLRSIRNVALLSSLDSRKIESVLNGPFANQILEAHGADKRSFILHLLMQIDYYAEGLGREYTGPRLDRKIITNEDRRQMISSYYSRVEEVEGFRACLSRVLVESAREGPSVHQCGVPVEAVFKGDKGEPSVVLFVPSDRCARDRERDGERLLGPNALAVRMMKEAGIKVHVFTHGEMQSSASQIEATTYIRKKIRGK